MDSNKLKTHKLKYVISFLLIVLVIFSHSIYAITPTSDAVVSETLVDYNLKNASNTSGDSSSTDSLSYAVSTRLQENPYNNYEDKLSLNSGGAILIDEDVDKILYEKNAYQKMYPASTTKTLTAILTVEKCDLNAEVAVSYWAVKSVGNNYSKANLVAGEVLTIKDLLCSMMIESANDSAYVLAQFIANNCQNTYPTDSSDTSKIYFEDSVANFATMMNEKAKTIGCINSNFLNPNGMHIDKHYSCAYDLALIGAYAHKIDLIKEIAKTESYPIPNTEKYTGKQRTSLTTNALFKKGKATYYEFATGLKTGYTSNAKNCLIATAEKEDRHLLCVVLYAEGNEREADCKKLFEYGFNTYSYSKLVSQNDIVQSVSIINATSDTKELNVLAKDEIKILINLEEDKTVEINPEIIITKKIAPVSAGEKVGTMSYTVNGVKYETDLLAEHDVEVKNYFIYIGIIFGVFLVLLVIVVIVEKRK